MNTSNHQKMVQSYITAYNKFDVATMTVDMHDLITFENISNGHIDLQTNGINEFKIQAEKANGFFKEREQKITNMAIESDVVTVDIEYRGILAIDLPNGMKIGDELKLNGKSIFKFKDNKIVGIQDIS